MRHTVGEGRASCPPSAAAFGARRSTAIRGTTMKGPTVVVIDLSETVPSPVQGPRSQHPASRWILPMATLLLVVPLLGPGSTVAGPVPIGIRITRSDVVLAA